MSKQQNTAKQLKDDFARLFSPAMLTELKRNGLDIIESKREGSLVFDENGKRYIDCHSSGGAFNLGRHHAELAQELNVALTQTDQGNFPMISKEKAMLAQTLSEFIPGPLECSVFSVMRGEPVECACKVSRGFTGRQELITVDGGWYGETGFALTLSERVDKDTYAPLIPNTKTIAFNDIEQAKQAISSNTAAVILELTQAENHCRTIDKNYLSTLRSLCDRHGALLIFDETQTGFGRTGKRFAFESYAIQPDILIVGEALGGGMFPICATVLTQRVNAFLNDHPMIHLSTFGGSDLGCRVATKALKVYEQAHPWDNASAIGAELKKALENLSTQHEATLRSVAGQGLLLSLQLKSEQAATDFCRELSIAGVLAQTGKVARNTVLLRPSLLLSKQEADDLLLAVATALDNLESSSGQEA